jgi:hypothetical protein
VKVGREPFDPAVRAALEANNPGVRFDWRQILETPIPSADAEKWRERRRAERSERAARQALDQEDDAAAGVAAVEAPKHVIEAATAVSAIVASVETSPQPIDDAAAVEPQTARTALPAEAPSGLSRRKRRRRRGGRGRDGTTVAAAAPTTDGPAPAETSTPGAAGDEHATDTDE